MLIEFTDKLYAGLEQDIEIIGLKHENSTKKFAEILAVVQETLRCLRQHVIESGFTDMQEEALFFKTIKPKFYSKYIYFINVYNFMLQQPIGSDDAQREYITAELSGLKRFFDHNNAFYQYYRSDATHLDELYFTRGPFVSAANWTTANGTAPITPATTISFRKLLRTSNTRST